MLITTQDEFADYEIIETLGLVRGNTIRARHIGKDILAALRNLVGGEVQEYSKMLAEAREQSLDRMIADAKSKGADGVVCFRFTTSTVMTGAAELLSYGTAVKLRKKMLWNTVVILDSSDLLSSLAAFSFSRKYPR